MAELALLGGVGLLVWFWADTLRARERAIDLCRAACGRRGLQLLDQTVALDRLRPGRDERGRLRLQRRYRFEFTRDGRARDSGTVLMLGARMQSLELPDDGHREFEHTEL